MCAYMCTTFSQSSAVVGKKLVERKRADVTHKNPFKLPESSRLTLGFKNLNLSFRLMQIGELAYQISH